MITKGTGGGGHGAGNGGNCRRASHSGRAGNRAGLPPASRSPIPLPRVSADGASDSSASHRGDSRELITARSGR